MRLYAKCLTCRKECVPITAENTELTRKQRDEVMLTDVRKHILFHHVNGLEATILVKPWKTSTPQPATHAAQLRKASGRMSKK